MGYQRGDTATKNLYSYIYCSGAADVSECLERAMDVLDRLAADVPTTVTAALKAVR